MLTDSSGRGEFEWVRHHSVKLCPLFNNTDLITDSHYECNCMNGRCGWETANLSLDKQQLVTALRSKGTIITEDNRTTVNHSHIKFTGTFDSIDDQFPEMETEMKPKLLQASETTNSTSQDFHMYKHLSGRCQAVVESVNQETGFFSAKPNNVYLVSNPNQVWLLRIKDLWQQQLLFWFLVPKERSLNRCLPPV